MMSGVRLIAARAALIAHLLLKAFLVLIIVECHQYLMPIILAIAGVIFYCRVKSVGTNVGPLVLIHAFFLLFTAFVAAIGITFLRAMHEHMSIYADSAPILSDFGQHLIALGLVVSIVSLYMASGQSVVRAVQKTRIFSVSMLSPHAKLAGDHTVARVHRPVTAEHEPAVKTGLQ